MYNQINKVFRRDRISSIFQDVKSKMDNEILSLSEDYILNVNIEEYTLYFSQNYELETPEILFDEAYVNNYEDDIPAERFGPSVHTRRGETYRKEVIQYFLPVKGPIHYLGYRPATRFTSNGVGIFPLLPKLWSQRLLI